jgi:CheY-like chemotaxis protein
LRDDIPAPVSMNPGVPRALSDVVMTALSRNPEGRFPSALKMAKALQAAIPSMIYTQEETQKLMAELFGETASLTRALSGLAERGAEPAKLEAAAAKLQEQQPARGVESTKPLARAPAQGTDAFGRLPTGVMHLTDLRDELSPFDVAATEPVVEGASVLSVDDSEISRDFIEAHLETHGFPVLHCGGAAQALELIAQRLPDLILLDVVMPDIDGITLCRMIRERSTQRPFLPIVFLSASSAFEERLDGLAAGGDDFIRKPFQPEELIAIVRAHLRRAAFLELTHAKARAAARRGAGKPA